MGGPATLPTFTPAGTFGVTGSGALTATYQLSRDANGNLWVADYFGGKVEVFDGNGTYVKTLNSLDFANPTSVKVLADGTTLVTDEGAGAVFVFDRLGTKIGSFGEGVLVYPEDVEIIGKTVYVTDWYNSVIVVFR